MGYVQTAIFISVAEKRRWESVGVGMVEEGHGLKWKEQIFLNAFMILIN